MSNLHICYVFRIGQCGTQVPENAEDVYRKTVKKLIGLLYSNPRICAAISFSGIMFEWYEKQHPEVMDVLRDLTSRKQVEILSGGYYDPLFPLLVPVDRLGQIEQLQNQFRKTIGKKTRGIRLPQNAWEPQLVQTFNSHEFEYVILDSDFLSKKSSSSTILYSPHIVEDAGKTITVIPQSSKFIPSVEVPIEDYINSLKKLIPGQESKIICSEITLDNLEKLIADNWFHKFIDSTIFEENIEFSNPEKFLKSNVKYIKNFIPSNSSISIENENIGATRNIFTKYPESLSLYARTVHAGNLINLSKGDKLRKKLARENLWKAQNYIAFIEHNSYLGVYERQKAYKIILQSEKSIKDISSVKLFSVFDYDMDGYKEYISQFPNYSAFVSQKSGCIFELDLYNTNKNYVGEKRKLFSDFFIDKESIPQLENYSDGKFLENSVFQDLVYSELKVNKQKNEMQLLAEGFYGKQKQAIQLKKTYTFYENGIQLQYILRNNSVNKINGFFGVETNIAYPLDEFPNRKIEIITDSGIESPCVDQMYIKQNDVSWIQIADIDLETEFIFELNESASYYLHPLKIDGKMISNCSIFLWNVDIQPGFEIEKTIFLNIKSPGKKSLSKKKK